MQCWVQPGSVPFQYTHSPWQWKLCLSGELCQRKKGWSRCPMLAGLQAVVATGNICFFCTIPRSKQVCMHAFHEQSLAFLLHSSKSHWSSNYVKGLIALVLDPRAGVPNMWLKLLTLQSWILGLWHIPLLMCPLLGVQTDNFSSLPTWFPVDHSLQTWL